MKYQILNGDNRSVLKTIPDNSIDSVITDPPYGIDFLGKSWDADTGSLETYRECLRVLKPGGHLLAFSAARTYHHLAITLEQAGFEIRDQIMWIYSSGFPKSQDVGKNNDMPEWQGWGTSLKPAHEPICLARKPTKLSIAQNVQRWGTGALNIDAARIPIEGQDTRSGGSNGWDRVEFGEAEPNKYDGNEYVPNAQGRFPSNVIGEIAEPYQKYFYCPKVSRAERHIGFDCDITQVSMLSEMGGYFIDDAGNQTDKNVTNIWLPQTGNIYIHGLKEEYRKWCEANGKTPNVGNNHPTVKPVELMKYLIKLVTPPNGKVLDPFNGSGSTGMAAVELGHEYIGIEQDANYCEISKKRIEAWLKIRDPLRASGLFT